MLLDCVAGYLRPLSATISCHQHDYQRVRQNQGCLGRQDGNPGVWTQDGRPGTCTASLGEQPSQAV